MSPSVSLSKNKPGLQLTTAWVSARPMKYFVVDTVDNTSLMVVRHLIVNGEVKETVEGFGVVEDL